MVLRLPAPRTAGWTTLLQIQEPTSLQKPNRVVEGKLDAGQQDFGLGASSEDAHAPPVLVL